MTDTLVDQVARAVLYEGYALYPYRPSSVKNRRRFNFGVLAPAAYSEAQRGTEACSSRTECLVRGDDRTAIDVIVRFLHLQSRDVTAREPGGDPLFRPVASLRVDDAVLHSWQDAVEGEIRLDGIQLSELEAAPRTEEFTRDSWELDEEVRDASGELVGRIARTRREITGSIELQARRVEEGIFAVAVRVANETPFEYSTGRDREDALLSSLVSAHVILRASGGQFVSLLDPPEPLRRNAAACENVGTWPVLVGEEGACDCMLSSPIILYDYPAIAPESVGDLFDGTEIDEILTLRIMTLTEEEKREMRDVDERTRRILERTDTLPEAHLAKLHGALRGLKTRERGSS